MKTLFFIFAFFILSTFLFSTIINIPADQPTIQEGINVAVDGDTVLVQPDTYIENINYNGKNIIVASLFLTTQDTIYISQTIIDGNENGSVVTFESGEDSTAVLCGFTITNGLGGGSYPDYYGGGIHCSNSNPSLQNVIITGNSSSEVGGGIYCESSSPSLENIMISDNSANYDGGGIYCWLYSSPSLDNLIITGNSAYDGGGICCSIYSSPSLVNVTITDNSASHHGGGICCISSSPSLVNVTITGNSADMGGGIYCELYSSPSLENVTITDNSATYDGGGIFCSYVNSNPTLMNVTISGNSAGNRGGGISCFLSSPSLVNVTITGNSSTYGGGIFCYVNSNPTLMNVTITGNSSIYDGGGIFCYVNSNPTLMNCILWNDLPEEIYFGEDEDPNSITIAYSDIQGGEAGIVTNNNGTVYWLEGNINENPLFINTGEHPYSLLENSPCIDAGIPDTTGLNLPPYDIIGNLRIWDGDGNGTAIIDMGAYEYGAPPYVDLDDNVIVQTPEVFLHQNYPNPFNPETTISFSVTQTSSFVTLKIYNIKGQLVKTLVNNKMESDVHSVIWNGSDTNGNRVSSGIYFYKLKAGDFENTRKMILMK